MPIASPLDANRAITSMTPSSDVLVVDRLGVRFGAVDVLREMSFRVARGTSLAVIGRNGSGKTVLFRALIGAIPHSGTVKWAPDVRLAYVPQKLDIERALPITGWDLLSARANLASVPRSGVERTLARVGLAPELLRTLIGTMSGGQFQRILMAFALLSNPNVLLLDEPTAGVDEPGQVHLNEIVHRLQVEDGVTVLLISHELSVVWRYATNVLCLTPEHTCFGIPRRALTADTLAKVYGEPVDLFIHDDNGR